MRSNSHVHAGSKVVLSSAELVKVFVKNTEEAKLLRCVASLQLDGHSQSMSIFEHTLILSFNNLM